jgi:hypothetical protein
VADSAAADARRGSDTLTAAHEDTAALTKQIVKVEKEIDARVAALYGLE